MKRTQTWYWMALIVGIGLSLAFPIQSIADSQGKPFTPIEAISLSKAMAASNEDNPQASSRTAAEPADKKVVQTGNTQSVLDTSIEGWRNQLAKEKGFEKWAGAKWTSYPVGPGNHGFIVLLHNRGQQVGYMIVYANPDGTYRLGEYGAGKHPLFSFTTLHRSLQEQGLIPSSFTLETFLQDQSINKEALYPDALHASWKVTVKGLDYFFDAKTGDLLPVHDTELWVKEAKPSPRTITTKSALLEHQLYTNFSPLDELAWVEKKPLPVTTFETLAEALQTYPRVAYVGHLYDKKADFPFAVAGYMKWEGAEPYIAVSFDEPRYIPFSTAMQSGDFYPN
ncbi:hypothetical protein ABNC96_11365 [Paenibacillus larvae]|uniref:hypothetical protein n=1 Tax=Paenibacillus larvae TaxID=1464 RepID=UPI002853FFCC|nr:hypothetical protein [Paenibacillus larvae]MDR5585589.1 hypothetical protein [Paenibacillus larvae]